MRPLLIGLAIILTSGSCSKEEEDNRRVYTITEYELVEQQLYVKNSDATLQEVTMTSSQDSVGYRARINQLPDYLSRTTIRSFKRLDDTSLELSIRLDTLRLPMLDTVLYNADGSIPQLPNYRYDQESDYVYQCIGSSRTTRGPTSTLFPSIAYWNCIASTTSEIRAAILPSMSLLDTVLVSQLHLPYR